MIRLPNIYKILNKYTKHKLVEHCSYESLLGDKALYSTLHILHNIEDKFTAKTHQGRPCCWGAWRDLSFPTWQSPPPSSSLWLGLMPTGIPSWLRSTAWGCPLWQSIYWVTGCAALSSIQGKTIQQGINLWYHTSQAVLMTQCTCMALTTLFRLAEISSCLLMSPRWSMEVTEFLLFVYFCTLFSSNIL